MGNPCFLDATVGGGISPTYLCSHTSDHDQLSLILDVLGTPSIDDFYAISSPRSREYIRALPFRKGKDFKTMFLGANELVSVYVTHTRSSCLAGHRLFGEMPHV